MSILENYALHETPIKGVQSRKLIDMAINDHCITHTYAIKSRLSLSFLARRIWGLFGDEARADKSKLIKTGKNNYRLTLTINRKG